MKTSEPTPNALLHEQEGKREKIRPPNAMQHAQSAEFISTFGATETEKAPIPKRSDTAVLASGHVRELSDAGKLPDIDARIRSSCILAAHCLSWSACLCHVARLRQLVKDRQGKQP